MSVPTDDLKSYMCHGCGAHHKYFPEQSAELKAMTCIPTLPHELQTNIAKFCDMRTLAIFSRLSKEWNRRVTPLLWSNVDFFDGYNDHHRHEATAKFFVRCSELMKSDPDRFEKSAAFVRRLDVGCMFGIIIHGGTDDFAWIDDTHGEQRLCVFDVIARFTNLESLSIYVKVWWGWGPKREDAGKALSQSLKKLRSLKIGGQVPFFILQGFASLGHQITDLAFINLISVPGQDEGPEPVTFLSEEYCAHFTNLQSLHLCKLADMDPRPTWQRRDHDSSSETSEDSDEEGEAYNHEGKPYVSGMRWGFPRQGERLLLEEWAQLLKHTAKTLQSLKLENRYLCGYGWDDYKDGFIEPGTKHPDDYGVVSIQQSQRTIFPVLFNQDWPELKDLTLVGMGTSETVDEAVAHLKDRVTIEQSPARIKFIQGDCTPDEISTPHEFKDVYERGVWEEVEEEGEGSEQSENEENMKSESGRAMNSDQEDK
ncbi:hypothetical protein CC79DRAFT_1337053 [Sarocladium strictum]